MDMSVDLESSSIEYDFGNICDLTEESFAPNEEQAESLWTKVTVDALLEECLKRQKEFHSTGHRRIKFFSAIRESMLERGFIFNAKSLEKKFYNLKKHFFTICKSREGDTTSSTKPITWPYHTQMMQMFAEELDIEDAPTMASLYPDIPSRQTSMRSPNANSQRQLRCDEDSELKYGNSDEESRWEHNTVMVFLDECCRRKHELWDPKIRRRKIFSDIRRRLKERGYVFYQESLDRKLRNMKKQFQVIHDTFQRNKINRNSKRKRITWPYYEKLKILYGKEMERDTRHKRRQCESVESSTLALKFRPIAPKPEDPAAVTSNSEFSVLPSAINVNEDMHHSATSSHDDIKLPTADDSKSHPDAKHDDEKLKFIREIVAFEERRTIVAEQMLAEMIESNKIREKRLEFNRIKLEYVMRRKRKRNGSVQVHGDH